MFDVDSHLASIWSKNSGNQYDPGVDTWGASDKSTDSYI
jgi:hypothetical protein